MSRSDSTPMNTIDLFLETVRVGEATKVSALRLSIETCAAVAAELTTLVCAQVVE